MSIPSCVQCICVNQSFTISNLKSKWKSSAQRIQSVWYQYNLAGSWNFTNSLATECPFCVALALAEISVLCILRAFFSGILAIQGKYWSDWLWKNVLLQERSGSLPSSSKPQQSLGNLSFEMPFLSGETWRMVKLSACRRQTRIIWLNICLLGALSLGRGKLILSSVTWACNAASMQSCKEPYLLRQMHRSWGMSIGSVSRLACFLFQDFEWFKQKQWPSLLRQNCYEAIHWHSIAIITACAPGQHIWPSLGPLPDCKCSKTVEVHNKI